MIRDLFMHEIGNGDGDDKNTQTPIDIIGNHGFQSISIDYYHDGDFKANNYFPDVNETFY